MGIPARNADEQLAKRRRYEILKVAIIFCLFSVLMYLGFQGKHRSRVQAKINEITLLRDRLQQKLDDDQRPPALATNATWPNLSDPEIPSLLNTFKARLDQFDSDQSGTNLPESQNLELRLSQATLANAERRFTDVLAMITDKDENQARSVSSETNRLVRVLEIRADSFYGLHQWQDALACYQQLLALQPNRLVALARIADSQYALGKTNEALRSYAALAKKQIDRANTLRLLGKPDAAAALYSKAKEYETRSKR